MQIAKKVIEGTTLTFEWADESDTSYDLSMYPPEIVEMLATHGLKQKLGDSYSGATNNGWDIDRCKAEVADVSASLVGGDWNRKGGGGSSGGIWVEALARATGETVEAALEAWNEMDDEVRTETKKHPQVKLAKAEIDMERAKAKAAAAPTISL